MYRKLFKMKTNLKVIFTLLIYLCAFFFSQGIFAKTSDTNKLKCVSIFYERMPSIKPKYQRGRLDAILLQNLIGHFPHIQQYIIPIDQYKQGQINNCEANFYIGSRLTSKFPRTLISDYIPTIRNVNWINYNISPLINSRFTSKIPRSFIRDFISTKRNVVWINDNISQLGEQAIKKIWSAQHIGIARVDRKNLDINLQPGFYKFFEYKNETFLKSANFDKTSNFSGYNEIIILNISNKAMQKKYVIAWAKHSSRQIKTPYILRNKNHWYFADNPFLYVFENDRYLIFADVLFDMLNEKPIDHGKKFALVRLEDISPHSDDKRIRIITDLMSKYNVPFAISLIPLYVDPLGIYKDSPPSGKLKLSNDPKLISTLEYAKKHGASFIMHGISHQLGNKKNPYSGISGHDFEFWDKINEKPIANDTPKYVLNRISKGLKIIQDSGFNVVAWLTQHYKASALDYVIFGKIFKWNVGRVNYAISNIDDAVSLPGSFLFNSTEESHEHAKQRLSYFKNFKVKTTKTPQYAEPFLPYTIYGDYYGQRLIPENLGNVQPALNEQVINKRTVDDIIQDAKRNLVLRDVWASFFIHLQLLNLEKRGGLSKYSGDTSELERLIRTIKALGYEFVDLKTWTRENSLKKRPKPISGTGVSKINITFSSI